MNREEIRSKAIENVDARHGYTSSPEAHLAEYDEEEQRLLLIEAAKQRHPAYQP